MTHETLLEELPTNMRSQLITLIFKQNNLDSIAFFQGKSPEFLHQILPLLKRVSLAKDELIYRSGDWVDESIIYIYIYIAYIYIYSVFHFKRGYQASQHR